MVTEVKPVDILVRMDEILSSPDKWTKGLLRQECAWPELCHRGRRGSKLLSYRSRGEGHHRTRLERP